MRRYLPGVLLWSLFSIWLLAPLLWVIDLAEQGTVPVDFLAYQRAAEAIDQGQNPYVTPAESREMFRGFHHLELELEAAQESGEGRAVLADILARPQQPGPYVYPPSLALWIAQFDIDGRVFTGLILLSLLGFVVLWFQVTGAHAGWLLLVVGSRDLLATVQGGNVELLLVFASLVAARLIWDQRLIWAVPPIARQVRLGAAGEYDADQGMAPIVEVSDSMTRIAARIGLEIGFRSFTVGLSTIINRAAQPRVFPAFVSIVPKVIGGGSRRPSAGGIPPSS